MKTLYKILLIVSILLINNLAFAQVTIEKSQTIKVIDGKKFYVHTVKQGQTLYSISKTYNVSVKDIAQYNPKAMNGINNGDVLTIPVNIASEAQSYHIVKAGETLYSISRLYNTTPNELQKLNPDLVGTSISVGQKIYYKNTKITEASKNVSTTEVSTEKVIINGQTKLMHNVKKGETLYSISHLYNIPVEIIKEENHLIENNIREGQTIYLPSGKTEYRAKKYFYHDVQKGETLFSIAKLYKTDITELSHTNPVISKIGMKQGMVLKIEITRFNKHIQEQTIAEGIVYHEVQSGESAYSIASKYNIPFKKLKKVNSVYNLDEISNGMILKVPTTEKLVTEYISDSTVNLINEQDSIVVRHNDCNCDSISSDTSRTINIAVLLPFFLSANDSIINNPKIINKSDKIYAKSLSFIEFYEGILAGLDTLKHYGYNIHLSVYDTEMDSNIVKKIFPKITKSQPDLIIGPVFYQEFLTAANLASKFKIPIISPLMAKTGNTAINKYIIAANTPTEYRIATSAMYFSQFIDQNFIIMHNGHVQEMDLMEKYKNSLRTSITDSSYFNNIVFKELNFNETNNQKMEDAMSSSKKNIFIIPSNDQAFVSDAITKLYQFKNKYDIELYGFSNWETFDNIELEYMYNLNLHISTSNYINYEDDDTKSFIKNYKNRFFTEPTKFSFQGYDLIVYFATASLKYQERMMQCLPELKAEGLQIKFDFKQENKTNGAMVNHGVYLTKYTPKYTRELILFEPSEIEKNIQDKINSINNQNSEWNTNTINFGE